MYLQNYDKRLDMGKHTFILVLLFFNKSIKCALDVLIEEFESLDLHFRHITWLGSSVNISKWLQILLWLRFFFQILHLNLENLDDFYCFFPHEQGLCAFSSCPFVKIYFHIMIIWMVSFPHELILNELLLWTIIWNRKYNFKRVQLFVLTFSRGIKSKEATRDYNINITQP